MSVPDGPGSEDGHGVDERQDSLDALREDGSHVDAVADDEEEDYDESQQQQQQQQHHQQQQSHQTQPSSASSSSSSHRARPVKKLRPKSLREALDRVLQQLKK